MGPEQLADRYREFQEYVGWTEDDAARVLAIAPLARAQIPALVDDFYEEIERHPNARKVITGGQAQIERLKGTLARWVEELLSGTYDAEYVARRWWVGWRHVEIGLDQAYTNVALSRLRSGLVRAVSQAWQGDAAACELSIRSLNKLLDLDLAIIEDAYQAEYAQRLQRNERLATLGQIAGGVAHELRNPLNVVKTSVYYLLNARNLTPEKKLEHLERIERQVELADKVIQSLSSFARMPIPNLVPFDASALIHETLASAPPPESVSVSIRFDPEFPETLGDPGQLQIVFSNLIRNACDAMPDGGRLEIAGRYEGDCVRIALTDSGVGIPSELLPKILEPLFSTKARGLGLGLAIARSILEKNEGSLQVESIPGTGSTFTVRLKAVTVSEPAR